MYFHGSDRPSAEGAPQWTRIALSADGLHFEVRPENLGEPYFRVVRREEGYLALAMPGVLYRSADGIGGFERGPRLFDARMRHSALLLEGERLLVFYSRVGDAPERILMSEVELASDWRAWRESAPVNVLAPERDYEGAGEPLRPSRRGMVCKPVRELRDPAVFVEGEARYLLYSVAGERGIAVARLL